MLKTYLYIPEELNRKIINSAKAQKKSKAEILRQAIEKGINSMEQKESAASLFVLAEIGKRANFQGVHDSSRMDELLWGKDWSKDE